MYIPDEIKAPKGWTQVTVNCEGVEEDLVTDLCAEFTDAGLRVLQSGSTLVASLLGATDPRSRFHAENGVIPDLAVRGFTDIEFSDFAL